MAGKQSGANEMAYAASKHAMKGFFDALQFEATRYNITIVNVYIGAMKTDMAADRVGFDNFISPMEVAYQIYNLLVHENRTMRLTELNLMRKNY